MKKTRPTQARRFLVNALSAGIMILGIGSISWAIYNMWDDSQYAVLPVYAESTNVESTNTEPDSTIAQDPFKESEDRISPAEESISTVPTPEINLYPIYPATGDTIGSLSIPSLNKNLPIIEGTGADELKKGVGHFFQSALPGENNNCVLSGHRDTVFAGLGSLQIGEQVSIHTSAGTFTYEIRSIRIVHKDDLTVIVPSDLAVLTLTTCYPFHYVGFAPDRYIVSANMIITT